MRLLAMGFMTALALAACGEDEEPARTAAAARSATPAATTPAATPPAGTPVYPHRSGCTAIGGGMRFCRGRRGYGAVRGVRVRRPEGTLLGGWVWAALSPDRRTLVMQWSGECEVPRAYLARARGGRPEPLAGDQNAYGLGWTTDGRAIVFVPEAPGCGSSERAGLFLVAPDGRRTRIGDEPVQPSVRPRPLG